jgi:hypothetical protein
MKDIVRRPFISALLLSLPLWIALNNYLVALAVALLVAFMASMVYSLWLMKRDDGSIPTPPPHQHPAEHAPAQPHAGAGSAPASTADTIAGNTPHAHGPAGVSTAPASSTQSQDIRDVSQG